MVNRLNFLLHLISVLLSMPILGLSNQIIQTGEEPKLLQPKNSSETSLNSDILRAIHKIQKGGGYAIDRKALKNFTNGFHLKENNLIILHKKMTPSFCSSAVYLALMMALNEWNGQQKPSQISQEAWQILLPKPCRDGYTPWGYANANGPGFAILISQLDAGSNFTQWDKAQPGDIMKIWWTTDLGKKEKGHLTVFIDQTESDVQFWSSNQSNPGANPGYGIKTIPKDQVKRVLFTRILKPDRFNNAKTLQPHIWLYNLLTQATTWEDVLKQSKASTNK